MKKRWKTPISRLILVGILSMALLTGCASMVNDFITESVEFRIGPASFPEQESTNIQCSEADSSTRESMESTEATQPSVEPTTDSITFDPITPEKGENENMITDNTPYDLHGALHVEDGKLKDAHGEIFQLYGMSSHGIGWYPQYICKETLQYLNEEYGTNCIRLAMYTAEDVGYCTGGDKEFLKNLVKDGVKYATELGMYVIVDWHILSDNNPQLHKEEAKKFLGEISEAFKDQYNVIYEICNEPNNTDWNSVKTYAEEVIPIIRANDPDAVIIVGTPTWSQDLECPLNDPVNYDNIMYALHFYAGSHKDDLRNRAQQCIDRGLPVFVSEFGVCDASGNGGNDYDSFMTWMELIEKNQLSFCNWALGNRDESCCIILPDSDKLSQWTDEDLNESGKWILDYFKSKMEQ